ncbi:Type II secretion system F domain protein [[Bacillus] selenitireducens MLS10]|uniref:Type II secretion system F domain protein n=2 Tax=Salisediminibacterium selenitireducens TaxID=85683 RepID=D6XW42_BACIE|nr:Type II secretion system F domain protein [[Bacillus] selenitireducens MLS10]
MTQAFTMSKSAQEECLRQWSELLKEGYSIREMLALYGQFASEKEQQWVSGIESGLQEGAWIAYFLEDAGFSKEITGIVLFAEKFGDLIEGLSRSADILGNELKVKEDIRKVFHYPAMLALGFIVIVSVLIQGIFPRFDEFFHSMGAELPAVSVMTFHFFRFLPLVVGAMLVMAVVTLIIMKKRLTPIQQLHTLVRLPLIRQYVQSFVTYHFISQLKPLLSNGFSLQEALIVIGREDRTEHSQIESERIRILLTEGESFSDALFCSDLYLPQFVHIIKMGEAKGKIAEEMDRFSQVVFRRLQKRFSSFLTWFQPLFFLMIGSMMVLLFASLLLPVFSILDQW